MKLVVISVFEGKGPLWILMKNSPRRVEKYFIFSALLNGSVYPKVYYFHKFEDLICLKNVKFGFNKKKRPIATNWKQK